MQRLTKTAVSVLTLLVVAAVAFAGSAQAAHPEVFGARALGMGGAFTAVVDDATALYWNPAAIGLSAVSIEGSAVALGIGGLTQLRDVMEDPVEFLEWEGSATAYVGALGAAGFGPVAVGGVIVGDVQVEGTPTVKEGHVQLRNDIAVGFGTDVLGDSDRVFAMRAGVTVRRIGGQRLEFTVQDAVPDPLVVDETEWSASGYAVDVGVLAKATDIVTIGATARNVLGRTTWTAEGQADQVDPAKMEFRAGIAIEPPLLGGTIAADIASGGEIRYGVEKRLLFNGLALRIGQIHRDSVSWTTAGIGLALGPIKVNAAAITPDFKDYGYAIEASFQF